MASFIFSKKQLSGGIKGSYKHHFAVTLQLTVCKAREWSDCTNTDMHACSLCWTDMQILILICLLYIRYIIDYASEKALLKFFLKKSWWWEGKFFMMAPKLHLHFDTKKLGDSWVESLLLWSSFHISQQHSVGQCPLEDAAI